MSLNAFAQQIKNKAQSHCSSLIANATLDPQAVTWNKPIPTGLIGRVLYVSNSDDTLLIVSSENIPAEIQMSVFTPQTGKWSTPEPMIFNDKISPDKNIKYQARKELFISLKSKKGDLDLYSFLFCNGECSSLSRLNDNINSKYNEKSACLSQDGNTLYFSSDRKGGKGGYDIYVSEKRGNGDWGPAQNLGKNINTKADEDAPFILNDDVTLYFNSKGHGSSGISGIFTSTQNEEGLWSLPENMINTMNAGFDEQYGYLTADEKILFYSSPLKGIHQVGLEILEFKYQQMELTFNSR
jgi:hypothetical protein